MKTNLTAVAIGALAALFLVSCAGNPNFTGGKNYVKQGVWDKAAESFELAAAHDPNNAEIQYNLGWAYCEIGEYQKAGAAFAKSKKLSDQFADQCDQKILEYWTDLAARGQDLKDGGQFDDAAALFEDAVDLKPDDLNTLWFVADLYGQMGNVDKAQEKYEKALELNPDNDTTLTNYANFLGEHDREAQAIPLFERLSSMRPDDENLSHHLARLYERAGMSDKALAIYKRLGDASAVMNDAFELYENEDFEHAAGLYEKAMMIAEKGSGDYYDSYYAAAAAYYKAGMWDKAVEVTEGLVAEKGDDPKYYRLLGNSLKNAGRNNDALRAFKKSEELESRK